MFGKDLQLKFSTFTEGGFQGRNFGNFFGDLGVFTFVVLFEEESEEESFGRAREEEKKLNAAWNSYNGRGHRSLKAYGYLAIGHVLFLAAADNLTIKETSATEVNFRSGAFVKLITTLIEREKSRDFLLDLHKNLAGRLKTVAARQMLRRFGGDYSKSGDPDRSGKDKNFEKATALKRSVIDDEGAKEGKECPDEN